MSLPPVPVAFLPATEDTSSEENLLPIVVVDCLSKRAYLESNNSKKLLFVMCVGLKKDGKPIFDLESHPWNSVDKAELKLKREDYCKEVTCRLVAFNLENPARPSNWSFSKSMEWLELNPIKVHEDNAFLTGEVDRLSVVFSKVAAEAEAAKQTAATIQTNGAWRGEVPYLRLVFCLVEDDIKPVYLRRAETLTRLQLDSRSSDQRDESCFEMISKRWNDSMFNPSARPCSCHSRFASTIDCSYTCVSSLLPATPEKVENCLTNMRSQLLGIIADWTRSGEGEGGNINLLDDVENGDDLEGMVISDEPSSSSYGAGQLLPYRTGLIF